MASGVFDVLNRGLPPPDAHARMHGERVAQSIRSRIEASSNKSISFADFMRACLYEPNLGYYTAGATKLGKAGDFTTAPEMSPLFGATLADAFRDIAQHDVLELGAGSGALAASFLDALPETSYRILEVSADLRERQQTRLHGRNVSWLDALPEKISGLVLLNEVLDAVPCEIVRFNESRYEQAHVAAAGDEFVWQWIPLLDGTLLDAAKHRMPPIDGYTSEINLEAEALAATLAARLDANAPSAICFIDYGFPRREFYMSSRRGGTLMCHYQHRAHSDPLVLPGLQDITSHIDFTAIAEACIDASDNVSVICYATQAKFLLTSGLLNRFEATTFASEPQRLAATGAIQKLTSPTEMGELFKVLIVGNELATHTLSSFAAIDECYKL
jgi:SAM-dependent MidA family methyltransferase